MADVKTPFGNVPRWGLYGGIVVGGGALIYSYVRKKNKEKTAASSAGNAVANTYGYGSGAYGYGTGAGVNPGMYGYGAYTYEPYGYGYGPFGLGAYGGSGNYGYGYYGAGVPVEVPQQASTNAQWAQAAITALTAQGYNGQEVLNALGPYQQGQALTQQQVQIVDAAIAVEGYPPVEGNSGYPPAIKTSTGGGGGGQTKNQIPDVVGLPLVDAQRDISDAGFKSTYKGPKFTAGKGAVREVVSQQPTAGTSANRGTNVVLTYKVSGRQRPSQIDQGFGR